MVLHEIHKPLQVKQYNEQSEKTIDKSGRKSLQANYLTKNTTQTTLATQNNSTTKIIISVKILAKDLIEIS